MMLRGTLLSALALVAGTGALQARIDTGAEPLAKAPCAGCVELAAAETESWGPKPLYALPKLPEGYKYAFGERRHNPNRGERTLDGRAAMKRIWTEETPQQLIAPASRNVGLKVTGHTAPGTAEPRYLPVGTFTDGAAAQNAALFLQREGLPVQIRSQGRGRSAMNVVLVGPFTKQSQVNSALATVRNSGFGSASMAQ